jgi:hypothetical protein
LVTHVPSLRNFLVCLSKGLGKEGKGAINATSSGGGAQMAAKGRKMKVINLKHNFLALAAMILLTGTGK